LRSDIAAGVRWLWSYPVIRTIAIAAAGLQLAMAGAELVVIIAAQREHASSAVIGVVLSTVGIGGVAGSLIAARFTARFRFGRTLVAVIWSGHARPPAEPGGNRLQTDRLEQLPTRRRHRRFAGSRHSEEAFGGPRPQSTGRRVTVDVLDPSEEMYANREPKGTVMSYAVDFETVSTVGLESSPVAEALAGLRANEARYFKNKYDHVFTTEPADDAKATVDWVTGILEQERGLVIASPPLEATEIEVDGLRWAYVFYESGLAINVMYAHDKDGKRAVGFKLSDGMEVPAELGAFKFARQRSKLAGTIRGSYFVIKHEY
jgi:hypothetical protein